MRPPQAEPTKLQTGSFALLRMTAFAVLLFLLLIFGFQSHAQTLNQQFEALQHKLAAKPDDVDLKMDLAFLYSQGLAFKEAIVLYEEVLVKDPDNLRATIETCSLYTQMRDQGKAIKSCENWILLTPRDFRAHDNLGLALFKFSEPATSLKPFLTALSLAKDSAIVRHHIALVFLALREFKLARDYSMKSLDLGGTPEEKAFLFHGLYLAYKGLRDEKAALKAIQSTYSLSANSLFLPTVAKQTVAAYQGFFFVLACGIVLVACDYFGKRLNRFLKNED